MKHFTARVSWQRTGSPAPDGNYPSGHLWEFDGGAQVAASAAPQSMPAPYSIASHVDPEEAFVAAAASCHMLFFLFFAQKAGFIVEAYGDDAEGDMDRNEDGRMAMTAIRLKPTVRYAGTPPDVETVAALHHKAHAACYIANSVKTRIETVLTD